MSLASSKRSRLHANLGHHSATLFYRIPALPRLSTPLERFDTSQKAQWFWIATSQTACRSVFPVPSTLRASQLHFECSDQCRSPDVSKSRSHLEIRCTAHCNSTSTSNTIQTLVIKVPFLRPFILSSSSPSLRAPSTTPLITVV
jgi:hypothetical protein